MVKRNEDNSKWEKAAGRELIYNNNKLLNLLITRDNDPTIRDVQLR